MATMSQKIADGPRRKNRREIGSTETGSLPMLENPLLFPNGLSASDYLAKLLGIELKTDGLSISPSQLLLSASALGTPLDCSRPLVIELFAGSFGWSQGFISEGYRSVGFDIEHENYHGAIPQHATLVLKDVLELNGSWFKNAAMIVCSPPCQEFSYMAMPWSRAKAIAAEYRSGKRDVKKLTALFDACFRIQREAIEASGRFIPMVVENVRGAQPWVGKARWNFGSYYLWGDVPALMPITIKRSKLAGRSLNGGEGKWRPANGLGIESSDAIKNNGGSWFNIGSPGQKEVNKNPVHELSVNGFKTQGMNWPDRSIKGQDFTRIAGQQAEGPRRISEAHRSKSPANGYGQSTDDGIKQFTPNGERMGKNTLSHSGSKTNARKAASATIAKIPFPLARWIAHVWKPKAALTQP